MHPILILRSFLFFVITTTASPPATELFSPLIPQKILSTTRGLSPVKYPQYTDTSSGNWLLFDPDTWTSGFFPGTLYALNTRKQLCGATTTNGLGSADWLGLGRAWSVALIPLEASNSVGHDVGFLSFPFVEELAINPTNQTALWAVNAFAQDLAARFNPIVGCTLSWDASDPTDFQVIIDNMMNLEVLFISESLTGNSTLRQIAIAHADKTMQNHIRDDGSTYHVVEYNSSTGAVIKRGTVQGFSDNSTWSRGQAWGIFGFTNMYKRTSDAKYLDTARRLAVYFTSSLPADGIVPWDFDAPLSPSPRPADSSAATVAANALLLLSQQETTQTAAKLWSDAAIRILNSITTLAWRPGWQSLLSNGTVDKPANNYLTGIVYGDYYYIKAGNELVSMALATC